MTARPRATIVNRPGCVLHGGEECAHVHPADAPAGLPTVDELEEAIHTVERPTKFRMMCEACRPKAERLLAALILARGRSDA